MRLSGFGQVRSAWGKSARQMMDVAPRDQKLAVSAMTFWEVAMLRNKGRFGLHGGCGAVASFSYWVV